MGFTAGVYSIVAEHPANGCFSPVDRVRSWIRQRFAMLVKKKVCQSKVGLS